MGTKVKSAKRIDLVNLSSLPDGFYPGTWSGYKAKAIVNDALYEFDTEDGVRGIDIPCVVHIVDGKAIVSIQ